MNNCNTIPLIAQKSDLRHWSSSVELWRNLIKLGSRIISGIDLRYCADLLKAISDLRLVSWAILKTFIPMAWFTEQQTIHILYCLGHSIGTWSATLPDTGISKCCISSGPSIGDSSTLQPWPYKYFSLLPIQMKSVFSSVTLKGWKITTHF